MTRPDWDLPDEWEVARRATGGDGRAASVGNAIVAGLAWVAFGLRMLGSVLDEERPSVVKGLLVLLAFAAVVACVVYAVVFGDLVTP